MSDLLTTRQVQELLQVDRTTIYRMLKDGRLTGVKVGHQWRFPAQQIENLLNGRALSQYTEPAQTTQEALPIDCFQSMQDVFSDITEISAVTTKPDGTPLTRLSHSCQFCQMVLNSETGRQACQTSWREMAHSPQDPSTLKTCHAGLHYFSAPITNNNVVGAVLIAGQFYNTPPNEAEEKARIQKLAQTHKLDEVRLANAAQNILILDNRQKTRIQGWLNKIAVTFEHISYERASFVNRLQQIANMSDLANDLLQPTTYQLVQL